MNEKEVTINQILATSKPFEALMVDQNFLHWKNNVVDKHIEALKEALLTTKKTEANWKELAIDRLVAYQQAIATYDTIFKSIKANADLQRAELRKIRGEE